MTGRSPERAGPFVKPTGIPGGQCMPRFFSSIVVWRKMDQKIVPIDLRRMARSIATSYGDKGAIIISKGPDGYRFGTEGLSPEEIEHAACLLIHYNFTFSDKEG